MALWLRFSLIAIAALHLNLQGGFLRAEAQSVLTFDQLAKNALKAQSSLAQCAKQFKDSSQVLDQVKSGMVSDVAANGCNQTQFSQFITQLQKVKSSLAVKVEAERLKAEVDFGRELRMQTLKNALMTYVDAESRYHLNSPNAQLFHKTKTLVNDFCQNTIDKNMCSAAERSQLEALVGNYRKDFDAQHLKKYTPEEAKSEINRKLVVLNQVYQPNFKSFDAWQKQRKTLRDTSSYEDFLKVKKLENKFTDDTGRYQKFKDQYLEEASSGVGLLLYSKAFRNSPSLQANGNMKVVSNQLIADAVKEMKDETLNLARETNTQFMELNLGNLMVKNALFKHDNPYLKSLKKMMRTNPVAAGQVLVRHPEMAAQVCSIAQAIEKDVQHEKNIKLAVDVVSYGALIVGGVVVLGVFPPAGIAMEAAGAAVIEASAVADVAVSAVRGITIMSRLNRAVSSAAFLENAGYMGKHSSDLDESISENQRALFAKTGGNVKKLQADEKESAELSAEIKKMAALVVVPLVAGRALKLVKASELLHESGVVKHFAEIHASILENPTAVKGLRVFDYACGALGFQACQLATSSLHSLPKSQQVEILVHESKMKSFLKKNILMAENPPPPLEPMPYDVDRPPSGHLKATSLVSFTPDKKMLVGGKPLIPGEEYAFVIDEHENMYAAMSIERHPSIVMPGDVLRTAGSLKVNSKGTPHLITNGTFTYKVKSAPFKQNVAYFFKVNGFEKPPCPVTKYSPESE